MERTASTNIRKLMKCQIGLHVDFNPQMSRHYAPGEREEGTFLVTSITH